MSTYYLCRQKAPSQQRLAYLVLVLDCYFHFSEMCFTGNTTGSRHRFLQIVLYRSVSWKQGLWTPACDRCNIPFIHVPHPKWVCNMEKSGPKRPQKGKKKKPPNDHRHRRQSARVQLLTTNSQALGMIPSLPAICSCSDIPAVSRHYFWHNKPVRPEWELPDSAGAQVYPVWVTNQQQQRKALVWCSRHSTKAELGYSIYHLLWWPGWDRWVLSLCILWYPMQCTQLRGRVYRC